MFSFLIYKNIRLLVHHDRDNNLKLLLSQSQPVQPLVIPSFSNLLPISLQWNLSFTLWFINIQVKHGRDCPKNIETKKSSVFLFYLRNWASRFFLGHQYLLCQFYLIFTSLTFIFVSRFALKKVSFMTLYLHIPHFLSNKIIVEWIFHCIWSIK